MEKISFFEDFGGFFIAPKKYTEHILTEKERNWRSFNIQSIVFIFLSSVFAGCVMMFYMMYPEVFFVPNAEHTGRLFLYAAAHPIFIFAMFGLGFILVLVVDILIQGSLSYWITKRTIKANAKPFKLSYGRFISFYSFTTVFTTLFYMITVFWIYFFEKFSYTKIFFPVTDLSLPVIIHFSMLGVLLLLKWIWEIRIKMGIFQSARIEKLDKNESIVISLCVRLGIVTILIMVFYFSGNLIAGAQWS